MRELAEPAMVEQAATGSLVDHLTDNAAAFPRSVAIRRKFFDTWRTVTYAQFHDEVRMIARGIAASGVQPGDRVGIMSSTRYEWTLADYAIWYVGAVPVPIYETSSADQVEWILNDSGAVALFLEGPEHRAVFEGVSAALPNVRSVWVFDEGAMYNLAEHGEVVGDDDLDQRRATLTPQSVATIVYTSGTTGRPKGCTLTHGNLMFEVETLVQAMPDLFREGSSTLMFIPLAHVFGRLIQLGCIRGRIVLGHTSDLPRIVPDLADFHPTFLLSVPRVFEKIYNGARQKAHAGGRGRLFDMAASVAIDYSRSLDRGGPSPALRLRHAAFDALVYRRLRSALGGRVTHAVSGGAALGERLGHFFRGVGITVLEGYGLTETTGASTINRPGAVRIGTVGRPIPGASVRIANDGEVLLRGRQIFAGYWNNEIATKEVLDAEGWFSSGDIGDLDDDGFLRITGRKKELIVTSGGKNVAPAPLEDRLRSHHLVSQCMVVGDSRPFIAALVTIDADALPGWLAGRGRPVDTPVGSLIDDSDLRAEIQRAIDDANTTVSRAESIRTFAVLPTDWTVEDGQLTPSMKLKRTQVLHECAREVESLYDSSEASASQV